MKLWYTLSESGDTPWLSNMADALLKLEDLNVITLNWGDISVGSYTKVVFNMYRAGTCQN